MDLLQHSKLIKAVFRSAVAKLPEDKVRAYESEEFAFGSSQIGVVSVFLIICTYSIVYPLILPFGLLYCVLRLAIQKYNLLCFYVIRFDSLGEVARHIRVALAMTVFMMEMGTISVILLNGSEELYIVCLLGILLACIQLPLTVLWLGGKDKVTGGEALEPLTEEVAERSYQHPCLRDA